MPIKVYKRQVNKKRTDGKHDRWSDKQKLEAVTVYMLVGKWPLVSDATKVPIDTLKKWKQADWWKEYEAEIRRASNIEASTKLKSIREKASEVVMDRLEHGDFQYDPKTGKFKRRPVGAKVASEIMIKSMDKEILLQKLDEKPEETKESVLDRLNHIADKLLEASGKKRKGEVIDVSPIERDDSDGLGYLELEVSTGGSTEPDPVPTPSHATADPNPDHME